ncbi:MAG: MBL fold metallo-hydrolase [Candidatus Krumholzibacteriota bacterium]|nr:MBL fold metallo-hydrolase [Candidatus Krumholzibacteriota bacterium]
MDSFRVTILGSGTIMPVRGKRATTLMVESGGEKFLFDCGPGAMDALAENNIPYSSVSKIFLTHFHPDHTLGIVHYLSALKNDRSAGIPERLEIIGPEGTGDFLQRLSVPYPSLPAAARIEVTELSDGDEAVFGGVEVTAALADHASAPALSYRADSNGRSIVYTGDTAYNERLVRLAQGADLLIAECSFPDSIPVAGHMTPSAAGRLAAEASAERLILIHLYPYYEVSDPIDTVKTRYKGDISTAFDGMTIGV